MSTLPRNKRNDQIGRSLSAKNRRASQPERTLPVPKMSGVTILSVLLLGAITLAYGGNAAQGSAVDRDRQQRVNEGTYNNLDKSIALIKTLKEQTGYITSLSFSPDGQTLASGSADKTIKLWKIN